jgi:SAM-dependent methyltransferase
LGAEIDLLVDYPRAKRNVQERGESKTEEDRAIARKFGKEFFDGERRHGYGGYKYNARFWQPVAPAFRDHFRLGAGSSVLDVGCGKGFMMHDFAQVIPGIVVKGIDVSEYAVANAIDDMRPHVRVADARELPFPDKSFDVVISINTVHNLARPECVQALAEIERVARRGAYITVDAYRSDEERERMHAWNLTAQTILHVDEWRRLFAEAGFTGDYYWFIP